MDSYGKPTEISRTIKNIGSQATQPAAKKAQQTAIGSRKHVAKATRTVRRNAGEGSQRSIHPGSAAGMNNENPAYLAMNNTGYSNPKNQNARFNTSKPPMHITNLKTEVMRARKDTRVLRRDITASKTSSFSRLSKLLDRD